MFRRVFGLILGVLSLSTAFADGLSVKPCQKDRAGFPLDDLTHRELNALDLSIESASLRVQMKDVMKPLLLQPMKPRGQDSDLHDLVSVPVVIHDRPMTEADFKRIMHPDYESPSDAGLMMAFRPGSSFSMKECGKNQVSLGESAANSMVHAQILSSKDGKSRYQKVDAVGHSTDLKLEHGDCVSAITVSARILNFDSGKGFNPLSRAVSDGFIETFHSYQGYKDPYYRKKMGMDRLDALLMDPNGNSLSLGTSDEDTLFLAPIRVSWDQYQKINESLSSKTTANYGLQGQVPVQKEFGQASVGAHANVTSTHRISDSWLASYGAGLAVNMQSTVFGGYDPADRKVTPTYNGTVAAAMTRIDGDGKGRTSYVVTLDKSNALLQGKDYPNGVVTSPNRFLAKQSRAAAVDPEMALGISIIRQSQNDTHQVTCKEDYNSKLGNKWDGNNNQDFSCSYTYRHSY